MDSTELDGLSDRELIELFETTREAHGNPDRLTIERALARRVKESGPLHLGSRVYAWDKGEGWFVRRKAPERQAASNRARQGKSGGVIFRAAHFTRQVKKRA